MAQHQAATAVQAQAKLQAAVEARAETEEAEAAVANTSAPSQSELLSRIARQLSLISPLRWGA